MVSSCVLLLASGTMVVQSAVVGSCGGARPSLVEDCQNVDFGGCGGACCNVVASLEKMDMTTAMQILNSSLADGGPDGGYALQMTAEGTAGFGDVRPYGGGWIGQVKHTTVGGFVDQVNFHIQQGDGIWGSKIAAFSVSEIGGALQDNGQNYKNIVMALKGAFPGEIFIDETLDGTCPSAGTKQLHAVGEERLSVGSMDPQGSCGMHMPPDVSPVADCQNIDVGTCAGACCGISVSVSQSKVASMQSLNETLATMGPDGAYEAQMTAQGSLGFTDLSVFGPFGFLGQVHHTTTGGFVDKMNFYIDEVNGKSTINAFSLSRTAGSYLDLGQNYKNIVNLLQAAFPQGFSINNHKFGSCADPSTLVV